MICDAFYTFTRGSCFDKNNQYIMSPIEELVRAKMAILNLQRVVDDTDKFNESLMADRSTLEAENAALKRVIAEFVKDLKEAYAKNKGLDKDIYFLEEKSWEQETAIEDQATAIRDLEAKLAGKGKTNK
jgi:septal ring factor EnvC (AmiA/AmiB activator)